MATLCYQNQETEVELPDDFKIAEACEEAGVPFACTEGVCGTCVIEVVEGNGEFDFPYTRGARFSGGRCRPRALSLPMPYSQGSCGC